MAKAFQIKKHIIEVINNFEGRSMTDGEEKMYCDTLSILREDNLERAVVEVYRTKKYNGKPRPTDIIDASEDIYFRENRGKETNTEKRVFPWEERRDRALKLHNQWLKSSEQICQGEIIKAKEEGYYTSLEKYINDMLWTACFMHVGSNAVPRAPYYEIWHPMMNGGSESYLPVIDHEEQLVSLLIPTELKDLWGEK